MILINELMFFCKEVRAVFALNGEFFGRAFFRLD